MSDSQGHRGAGPGPDWIRRTYEAVHKEGQRRVLAAERTGAERWHLAEEGGYDDEPPPEPLARGAASSGAGAELAAALARRGTSPLDLPAFDVSTEEGRELNRMAERVKAAYLSLGLTLAHYSPTRHTVYVMGRPVQAESVGISTSRGPSGVPDILTSAHVPQVVVLMHQGVDLAAYNPLHAWRFRPAPVIAAFSRTAGLQPVIQGKEAIWHWFMAPRPDACGQAPPWRTLAAVCVSGALPPLARCPGAFPVLRRCRMSFCPAART